MPATATTDRDEIVAEVAAICLVANSAKYIIRRLEEEGYMDWAVRSHPKDRMIAALTNYASLPSPTGTDGPLALLLFCSLVKIPQFTLAEFDTLPPISWMKFESGLRSLIRFRLAQPASTHLEIPMRFNYTVRECPILAADAASVSNKVIIGTPMPISGNVIIPNH